MSKTTLYIARHGQTEWNVEKRMQGQQDSPLTMLGKQQAQWLGEALASVNVDVIYASSSGRTVMTAKYLRGNKDVPIVQKDEFREMSLGNWEGKFIKDIEQKESKAYKTFWERPDLYQTDSGETFHDVYHRAVPEVRRILKTHANQSILIVTHTVTLKLIMAYFEGRPLANLWDPPYIHPACLCKIEVSGEEWKILLHGDISHYQKEAGEW